MSITEKRIRAVKALRENINHYEQIKGSFSDGCTGRCAMGLVLEEFGIDPDGRTSLMTAMFDELGMGFDNFPSQNTVFQWNDKGMTYDQVASELEKHWGLR